MNIEYAILGLLSWKPSSGYDLKKIIEESPIMYWSGNNNQIYKALIQLEKDGFATTVVQHQENSPSRKIYSITEKGLEELKRSILTIPEAPEWRKTFLIQLAWADMLTDEELQEFLSKYEEEIRLELLMEKEKKRRGSYIPDRTSREKFLWDKIYENIFSSLQNELDWVEKMRTELKSK